ncbi:MAG: hypothetical protein HY518_03970 [Candidatus Aenigmarchaeota archaeon]|nr:hypothetical protein [Candidatus Aenigmarchaeota archaeon]
MPEGDILIMTPDLKVRGSPRNYLLCHQMLSRQPDRGLSRDDNRPYFKKDLSAGRLSPYVGEWVAYWKGILCGEGEEGEALYRKASVYYGATNLAVFRVPLDDEPLEGVLHGGALGKF